MRLSAPLIFCSVAFLALALGLATQLLFPAPALTTPTTTTDNWRRTSTGWERTHSWPINHTSVGHPSLPTPHSSLRTLPPPRLDTHPAVLALLQITGSLLALAFFAYRPHPNSHHIPLSTLISRSFRASPFG